MGFMTEHPLARQGWARELVLAKMIHQLHKVALKFMNIEYKMRNKE
jgi:hypothetical protein